MSPTLRAFDPDVDDWDDLPWDDQLKARLRRWPGGELAELLIEQRRERQALAVRHAAERIALQANVRGERSDSLP